MRPGENRGRFNDLQGNGQPILIIFQSLLLFSVIGMSAMAVGSELVNAPIKMEHWPPYYYPHEAVVLAGVPIQWINATASPHTVRHDDCGKDLPCLFDSGKVDAGETYTLSGLPPGRYPYHCELHPIMGGTLIVEDPDEGTSPAAEPPSS